MINIVLALLFSFNVSIAQELVFGPEWTFTNQDIISNNELNPRVGKAVIKAWTDKVLLQCPSCEIRGDGKDRKIFISENSWIQFTEDIREVELNGRPSTLSELRVESEALQGLVWDTGARLGVAPHVRVGGGHIHISIDSIKKIAAEGFSDLLVRNFLAELFNSGELFLGALGFNLNAAPPLSVADESTIKAVEQTFMDFDQERISLTEMMKTLDRIFFNSKSSLDEAAERYASNNRYQALSFRNPETIEIRGIRPQESLKHYLLLCEFFEARVKRLAKNSKPLPLSITRYKGWSDQVGNKLYYFSSAPDRDVLNRFKNMVEEVELDWMSYQSLLTPIINKVVLRSAVPQCSKMF